MLEKEIQGKTYFQLEVSDVLSAKDLGDDYVVEDWPWGRKDRCSMHFYIESNKRGQRFVKQSTFKGRVNKPKTATYAYRVTLVEIEGKVGRVEMSPYGGHVTVRLEDGKYLESSFFDDDGLKIIKRFFEFSE